MRDTAAMLGRPLRALLVGLLASAFAGAVTATGALERIESGTVDARFDVRGSQGPPEDVVVVGIGTRTFDAVGTQWPFPRRFHARVIENLLAAGARTVAYDVQFSEPSDPAEDRALVVASRDPRVVLATADTAGGRPVLLPRLLGPGHTVGFALFPVDGDGVMRRLEATVDGVPHLAVLAAGGDPRAPTRPIDFAGPSGTVRTLRFEEALTGRLRPSDVRGKVVVVGATAESLQDLHATPTGRLMAGAEINANAIQTVLDGYPLRDAGPLLAVLLVLAAGLVAPLATVPPGAPGRALGRALLAGPLGAVALLAGAQLAFAGGTIVPVAAPLLALLFGTAGAVALTYLVEVRTRRRLRAELERFVAPAVATELLDRDGSEPLPSRKVEATVLFCDLRGFTTLSERLAADQVIAVLNRYLEAVAGAVLDHGGTVVSYQGDGVMAVFGAPLPQPDHAARALAAARTILDEALPRFDAWLLSERLAEQPLSACVGVNSGTVMAGVLGSRRRVEYAAVGDATNVAARLQTLGRDRPGRLFVSGTTVAALGEGGDGNSGSEARDAAGLRSLGAVELKGRGEPVEVWSAE